MVFKSDKPSEFVKGTLCLAVTANNCSRETVFGALVPTPNIAAAVETIPLAAR